MKPIVVSKTGSGTTAAVPTNYNTTPFNVGFGVAVTGTVNYTVQHCFDNQFDGSTPVWYDHPTIASQSANADGNYAFPVSAIRLKVNSGGGTAKLTIIQAGIA